MKYDVFGIGNAIVDIVTEVDLDFFERNKVEKGVMTLVDEKRQQELMKSIDMKRSKMSGGGSAGNTVVAINQLGGKSYYSCLVAHDDLGNFFLKDLDRNGVHTNLKFEDCPAGHTGRCLVMTSPDAQRTMNTFLGISSRGNWMPCCFSQPISQRSRFLSRFGLSANAMNLSARISSRL